MKMELFLIRIQICHQKKHKMDTVFGQIYVNLQTSALYAELEYLKKYKYESNTKLCIETIERILEERPIRQDSKRRRVG
jgi:hypothetical protein